MIAGLEEISSGTLSIGGEDVEDLAPKDRDIAMVFQSYALYPHMTVFDNIAFSMQLAGKSQAERDEAGRRDRRRSCSCSRCSTASPRRCPAGSGSGWPWGARWCASRRRS